MKLLPGHGFAPFDGPGRLLPEQVLYSLVGRDHTAPGYGFPCPLASIYRFVLYSATRSWLRHAASMPASPAVDEGIGRSLLTGENVVTLRDRLGKSREGESMVGRTAGVDLFSRIDFDERRSPAHP